MRTLLTLMIAMTATTASAFANDHLRGMRDRARDLEREFRGIHKLVSNKNFNLPDVQARLDWTAARVEKLKNLASEFEAADPHMASNPDWKKTKELVTLIDIFHTQKANVVSAGRKDKGLLKAQAEGLAKRSALLLQAAGQLAAKSSL